MIHYLSKECKFYRLKFFTNFVFLGIVNILIFLLTQRELRNAVLSKIFKQVIKTNVISYSTQPTQNVKIVVTQWKNQKNN